MTPTQRILDQIQEAQKLSEGATPGPWTIGHPGRAGGLENPSASLDWIIPPVEDENEDLWTVTEADWAFIAASRTLVPRLARQLEEAVKALEEMAEYGKLLEMPSISERPLEALSRIEQLGQEEK